MNEESFRCHFCSDRVDPADKTVVYAAKRGENTIVRGTGEIESEGRYFHRTCLPPATGYRERKA
jgi:hypothetical protein